MQPMYWRTYAAKAVDWQQKEMLFGFGKQTLSKTKLRTREDLRYE